MMKEKMRKSTIIILVMILTLSCVSAHGEDIIGYTPPVEVLLAQAPGSVTCTAVATAMMLRNYACVMGRSYDYITEDYVVGIAWGSGGMNWYQTYNGVSTGAVDIYNMTYADKRAYLINLLKQHPEGYVVYDWDRPHAVFLCGYNTTSDMFYCGDSAGGNYSGKLLRLCDSSLNLSYGVNEQAIISALDRICYITYDNGTSQPPSTPAATAILDPLVYNEEYYLATNADVAAQNWSSSIVQKHWVQDGIPYGRCASPVFDVKYYLAQNSDVASVFGTDYVLVAKHFIDYGIAEGRPSSSQFNFSIYKENYIDLQNAYGNNNYNYYLHYINAGRKEGRLANERLTVTFDPTGGTVTPTSKNVQKNGGATYGTLPTPSRTGYTFDGWYTASTGGNKITASTINATDGHQKLYAHWSPVSVSSVSFPVTTLTLNKGATYTLTANVLPANALNKAITWSSSNSAVVSVSNGTLSAKEGGTAVITATTADGGFKATCTVTVKVPVTGLTISQSQVTMNVGNTVQLNATITPSNATNKNVTWSSSNTTVATVSNGTVTAKASGTATITATTADGGFKATCTVTVKVPVTGLTISQSQVTMNVGNTVQLNATITPSNATNKNVTWSSSNTSVATVSNGMVTAKASGAATITATTADGGLMASCTVTVVVPVTGVTLNQRLIILEAGKETKLTATVIPDNATNKNVVWTSSSTSVATVSNGVVLGKTAGMTNIVATAGGNQYSASCSVIVLGNKRAILPSDSIEIEQEAFQYTSFDTVILPSATQTLGSKAFANCSALRIVYMPDSILHIAEDAFAASPSVILLCESDNTAAEFARKHSMKYVIE